MYILECPHDPPCPGKGCRFRFECESAPPCNVLLDVWSPELPDHVCPEAALATLKQVVKAWFFPTRYLRANELDVYNLRARLPFWSLFARLWPLHLQEAVMENPDDLPRGHLPNVEFLGAAVTRMAAPLGNDRARGVVTLLAPVEPVRPDGGAVVLSGSTLPGESPYLPEQWRFLPPAIDIQGEGDALEACYARAKELRQWYTKTLLGKTLRSGRRRYSVGAEDVARALQELRGEYRRRYEDGDLERPEPTLEDVADYLGVSPDTVQRRLREAGLTFSDL